jgi:hypothetical protein
LVALDKSLFLKSTPQTFTENPGGWFLTLILQQYGQTVWSQNTTAVPYPQWQQFLYFFQLANTLI